MYFFAKALTRAMVIEGSPPMLMGMALPSRISLTRACALAMVRGAAPDQTAVDMQAVQPVDHRMDLARERDLPLAKGPVVPVEAERDPDSPDR